MTPITVAWDDDRGTRVRIKVFGGSLQLFIGTEVPSDHVPEPDPPPTPEVVEVNAGEELARRVKVFFDNLGVQSQVTGEADLIRIYLPDHRCTLDAIDVIRAIIGPMRYEMTDNHAGPPVMGGTEGDSDGGEI